LVANGGKKMGGSKWDTSQAEINFGMGEGNAGDRVEGGRKETNPKKKGWAPQRRL